MEFNRDQIIKALEHCIKDATCEQCPCSPNSCYIQEDALSLIKELTEENDRLSTALAEYEHKTNIRISEEYVPYDDYEELREECEKWKSRIPIECEYTKADTVKKMQERLKEKAYVPKTYRVLKVVDVDDIDQIAKEMLEGE